MNKNVIVRGEKAGKCRVCGKTANIVQVFSKTVVANDYSAVISATNELKERRRAWWAEPIVHRACEAIGE